MQLKSSAVLSLLTTCGCGQQSTLKHPVVCQSCRMSTDHWLFLFGSVGPAVVVSTSLETCKSKFHWENSKQEMHLTSFNKNYPTCINIYIYIFIYFRKRKSQAMSIGIEPQSFTMLQDSVRTYSTAWRLTAWLWVNKHACPKIFKHTLW